MGTARRRSFAFIASIAAIALLVLAAVLVASGSDQERAPRGGILRNPIDPRQQTALAFGERSHWLQPWRAYLDTPPATRLRDAIGIMFNVDPGEADATAQVLARSGFRRARVEVGWDSVSRNDPGRLAEPGRFQALLGALGRHGIRPLILLNANHRSPGPTRFFTAQLAQSAKSGSRRVRLDRTTASQVTPGRTGLNSDAGKAADVLFTSVRRDGTATLSKPLPRDLPAGGQPAATLLYEPFGPPRLAGGRRNPRFERTLNGWLDYTRTIVREARAVLGDDEFDVEVWNELSFGSDFLYQERYYQPPRERGSGDVTKAILARTVARLRRESSRIGISNGFASQTPFPTGGPRGLTALSEHPYYGIKRFPAEAIENEIKPLDALGRPSFEEQDLDGKPVRSDLFTPTYDAFFPEYILTGIQTEHLIRDVSPITTEVYRYPHGRNTRPAGGGAPPGVWVTEANLDPTGADPADPANAGSGPIDRLTPADVSHLQAKATLRYYTAFVNKGVSAFHMFAVKGDAFGLVDMDTADGGETPRAVRRMVGTLDGAQQLEATRRLTLEAISDKHGNVQFEGDGTVSRPPLFDRDVVAFFPFQVDRKTWVAATYVMTRNLAKRYRDDRPSSDPTRYDLPEAEFRLAVGGVDAARLKASATDPLTGRNVDVKVVSRRGRRAVLELPLTDSPRMLRLSER